MFGTNDDIINGIILKVQSLNTAKNREQLIKDLINKGKLIIEVNGIIKSKDEIIIDIIEKEEPLDNICILKVSVEDTNNRFPKIIV